MTEDNPFVSIVVPAYNEEKRIGACIEALLDQSYPKNRYEVLIVDNGSTDNTRQIASTYDVRIVSEEEIPSSYAARNEGVSKAAGEVIAFTDADCVASPDWLSEGVAGFIDRTVGGVAGEILGGSEGGWVDRWLEENNHLSQVGALKHRYLPFAQTANVLYRKDVFDQIGFFEKDWLSGGDADFSWRMQSETDYSLEYRPSATVEHLHRADVRSLFLQTWKWGHGRHALRHKYGETMPERTLMDQVHTYISLLRMTTLVAVRTSQEKLYGRVFKDKPTHILNLVIQLGLELGELSAKVRSPGRSSRLW